MRNITVAIDEETHRLARIRAAELEAERRQRLLGEVIDDITSNDGGLRVAANVSRSTLYDRSALRWHQHLVVRR
ncbi:MAG: hypothetical protein F4138_00095 [Acidimicrobiia bacterium]|nr:hypothetical protein [Acidimicrobiia bacterium]